MKTLIIENIDLKKIGELVTVSKQFCDAPDIIALGEGDIPGSFGKAWQSDSAIPANLVSTVSNLIKQENYEVILMSVSTLGSGLAGPLSAALAAPAVTEVTAIHPDMVVDRPLYGGKAIIKHKIESTPTILTIRRKYFEPAQLDGTTASTALEAVKDKVTLVAEKHEQTDGIPLEDANVIVSGGRGIGDPENFNMLQEMANQLNGAVGASRGAVDEGWASPTRQIGQTGKIVAPSVYFAVGISGASQHLAGIANSKCVVAINKDEDANIFNRARFGVVCDYKKIVPILTQAIMEGK
ncbi:electron transfer flavoprotein subunit alpha/FixB family protein [Desulfobacula toluolica]|uniref:EtfA1: electron transfer flavoprotein, alpha-subunit n=1 Tax=Desulfobacula toluolica (strain DSM 7467 / Tol2) TaxID=651182 RepID=K0NC26_DESTT|nr:electron transfer flavoprotein subunit alpha/FixB family protein [Desulfobacula toluolica]CCK78326.1 EtfA1: electron transfer flavoprotein, alpha-subunit [Desulfobacula toluolica Tol2]